ncbi:MAG: hypothetical protein WD011_05710 [Nitriliruptoraceae bacterium]
MLLTSKREAQLIDRVRAIVEDVAGGLDVAVLDIDIRGQGPRRVVRVTADTAELDPAAALDVDTIADVSHRIGASLDAADVIPGSYTLEVTSPGADRPLRSTRDFLRNLGRQVRLVFDEGAAEQEVVGELTAADDDTVTVRIDGEATAFDRADVDHGNVVLPW